MPKVRILLPALSGLKKSDFPSRRCSLSGHCYTLPSLILHVTTVNYLHTYLCCLLHMLKLHRNHIYLVHLCFPRALHCLWSIVALQILGDWMSHFCSPAWVDLSSHHPPILVFLHFDLSSFLWKCGVSSWALCAHTVQLGVTAQFPWLGTSARAFCGCLTRIP